MKVELSQLPIYLLLIILGFILGFNHFYRQYTRPRIKKRHKFRLGRKSGRSILHVETGKEYLVFPKGKENEARDYLIYLNDKYKEQQNKLESQEPAALYFYRSLK